MSLDTVFVEISRTLSVMPGGFLLDISLKTSVFGKVLSADSCVVGGVSCVFVTGCSVVVVLGSGISGCSGGGRLVVVVVDACFIVVSVFGKLHWTK